MSNTDDGQLPAGPADLSVGVTTVAFNPVVPPLRIPVRAGADDDHSKGEWLLAFKDEDSWSRGWQMCKGKIAQQCEAGARMGCSIAAARACRIPWWKQALVFLKVVKLEEGEREACEEMQMAGCVASAKESCSKFAQDSCNPVFVDTRIVESHVSLDSWFTGPAPPSGWFVEDTDALLANRPQDGGNVESELGKLTNYRGGILMGKEQTPWSEEALQGGQEVDIDEWVGGLIRPKLEIQTKESGDKNI